MTFLKPIQSNTRREESDKKEKENQRNIHRERERERGEKIENYKRNVQLIYEHTQTESETDALSLFFQISKKNNHSFCLHDREIYIYRERENEI